MNYKIGIDLEDNSRFEQIIKKEYFMERFFTSCEREYIAKKGAKSACGIFCVKEAFSKALGIGILTLSFQSVSVEREKTGKPALKLYGKYSHLKADISISHSGKYTTAVCLVEGDL